MTGAVRDVITEGLLDEDDVVRRIAHWLDIVEEGGVCRVEQPAAGGQQRQHRLQQLALQAHQAVDGIGADPPAGVGVAGEGAEA